MYLGSIPLSIKGGESLISQYTNKCPLHRRKDFFNSVGILTPVQLKTKGRSVHKGFPQRPARCYKIEVSLMLARATNGLAPHPQKCLGMNKDSFRSPATRLPSPRQLTYVWRSSITWLC